MSKAFNYSIFYFLVILFSSSFSFSQTLWTVGPMLHINLGKEKPTMSYGLEFAYWNSSHFPYSVDMAVEFERHLFRVYSEIQTGIGIAGVSAGPVLEFSSEKPLLSLGFQSSIWGNYFLGADIRTRFIRKKFLFCPGVYIKGGFDSRDENGEKTTFSSSSHHHSFRH